MTIRIYPSRLHGEPLETHQHGTVTLYDWFKNNVRDWQLERVHPVCVEIDGIPVPSDEWPFTVIAPDTNVCLYPVPYATGAAVAMWVAAAVAVAAAAYSIYMMSQMDNGTSQPGNGDALDLSPAKANSAKLGDPIREIFGRYRIYPDYVVQPVSRFSSSDRRNYYTSMFLCIGVGNFSVSRSDIRIGATPIASLGDDVSYTIYGPGADVSAEPRADNWFSSAEVGSTTSGTSGLDLGSSGPDKVSINAEAIMVSGNSISLIDQTSSDDDDEDDSDIPASWVEGTVLTVEAPDSYTVEQANGYSKIYGDFSELAPTVGMAVTLGYNNSQYDLYIANYTEAVPAVPGEGGLAASITASAAPDNYNFSDTPVTFSLYWHGSTYAISLTTNYQTMSAIVLAITDQLTGSGLVAQDNSGLLVITEETSPWSGGEITSSSLPSTLFGSSPASVAGEASSGGTAAVSAHIELAYGSAAGTAFSGLPAGTLRLTIGHYGWQYRITDIDGLTINVERLLENKDSGSTAVDASWPGFSERVLLDGLVTGVNDNYDWMGPFVCCPDGETTTEIELNFIFPNGLAHVKSNGAVIGHGTPVYVQYRPVSGGEWKQVYYHYVASTLDAIGFTESISVPAGQYEVRIRRGDSPEGGSTRDSVYWQAMRSRLKTRPNSYRNVTTIALTVRTGNRLAAQSDRRVNVTATRLYDGYTSRSVSGALYHVLQSVGMSSSEIDTDTINLLEENFWTPRGERFDFSADKDNTSALDILKTITNAGMGYFLLSDGLCSAGREGVKHWTGIISPQETAEPLKTSFSAPSDDDYDGVDVTYINGTTWAEETIQCRLSDNPTPSKIEDYTLDGVVDPDRAYRIGMRRLMKYRYQLLTHSTTTEMDALCYNYMDRIVLTDDIPGTDTTSCLITDMQSDGTIITLSVSEPLDWGISNPRCLIRLQDGSASKLLTPARLDDYTLTIEYDAALNVETWLMNHPHVEPLRLVFCSSEQIGYNALISDISPGSDGMCDVTALQYDEIFYQYDDATYPGDAQ